MEPWSKRSTDNTGTAPSFVQVPFSPGPTAYEQLAGTMAGGGGSTTRPKSSVEREMHVSRSSFNARSPQIAPMAHEGASEIDKPGPGTYEICRDVGGAPQKRLQPKPAAPTERIQPSTEVRPGPDAYLPARVGESRATDFHTSDADQRQSFENKLSFSPGPGAYDLVEDWQGPPYYDPQWQMRSETRKPEFALPNALLVPGPGNYDEAAKKLRGVSAASSFNSVSPKTMFGIRGPQVPGPGEYHDHNPSSSFQGGGARRSRSIGGAMGERTFLGVTDPRQITFLRDTDGARLVAFHSSVPRKTMGDVEAEHEVGPGQYEADDLMGRSIVGSVASRHSPSRKGAFGAVCERFPAQKEDMSIEPGGNPQVEAGAASPVKRTPPVLGRAQLSRSDGDLARDLPLGERWNPPGPGAYDDIDLRKVDYRSKSNRSLFAPASFGAIAPRFHEPSESELPGPGEYRPPENHVRNRGGIVKSTCSRVGPVHFETAAGSLGPGGYEVSPQWLRKSFNASHAAHAKETLLAKSAAIVAAQAHATTQKSSGTAAICDKDHGKTDLPDHHKSLVNWLEGRASSGGGVPGTTAKAAMRRRQQRAAKQALVAG